MVDRWGDKLCWEYLQGQPHEERFLAEVGSVEATDIVQSGAAALLLAQQAILYKQYSTNFGFMFDGPGDVGDSYLD